MAKISVTYTLEHDEVMDLVAEHLRNKYGLEVDTSKLSLNVQEFRLDEGYGGPRGDQPARINWIKYHA